MIKRIFPQVFVSLFPQLFLFLLSFTSFSQILNVEKSRVQEDTTKKYIGNVSINFSLNNRSTTPENRAIFVGLTGNSNLGYFSEKHAYLLFGTINYTSLTGAAPISTGYGHFRINLNRKKKLSTELFAQIQYDQSRGMNYRSLAGVGARLNVINTENASLYFGAGLMWETEEWDMPDESDSIIVKNIPKSTNYVSVKARLNPFTTFNIINYYQVGFDNEQNVFRHRLNVDASLIFLINRYLSFVNTFNAGYENKPVVPILKFSYSLSNGILIKF